MIDKNFYLENLTAFDVLIGADRIEAEKAIFKVYCILQRDKYWLNNVATPEEIGDEDAELLEGVELELKELDQEHGFRFADFHELVMKEIQTGGSGIAAIAEQDDDLLGFGDDDEDFDEEDDLEDDDDDEFEEDTSNKMGDFTDEELNLVVDYILNSAKKRFDYDQFAASFPDATMEFIDDQVLLYIIARKAYGEPDEEIAVTLAETFELNGFEIENEELLALTTKLGKDFGKEILAFGIAMDSLQQGTHPVDVVAHISNLI